MNCNAIFSRKCTFIIIYLIVCKADHEYPHGAQSGLLSAEKSCCLVLRSFGRLSILFNEMDENKNGN